MEFYRKLPDTQHEARWWIPGKSLLWKGWGEPPDLIVDKGQRGNPVVFRVIRVIREGAPPEIDAVLEVRRLVNEKKRR